MNTTLKQPHGSENSSKLDTSPTVLSMKDQLPKSLRGTCEDIRNVISSLALQAGASRCNSQDGPQIDLFGQALAPASHSVQQAKDSETKTSATFGPSSSISSASAALSMSLASRLRVRLAKVGSMEYRQTWNLKTTPAGRQYWAHTASAHRTSDSDSTGWPTPKSIDGEKGSRTTEGADREIARKGIQELGTACHLTGWPTCSSRDWKDSPGMATTGVNPDGSIRTRLDQLPRVAQLVGWCSPTVTDSSRGVLPPRPQDTGIPLTQQVSGLTLNSSHAETAKPAASQLNPHFSRWLMGFPPEWCACAVMATPLSRKLPPNS